jgi:3-oxoacyl-[acyl-carrier-protein] synthase-1
MVYFLSDNIISSLGFSTNENFQALLAGQIGIRNIDDKKYYPDPFPASIVDTGLLDQNFNLIETSANYTRLEKMLILSIDDALKKTDVDVQSKRTGIIMSTTKGNIDLLEPEHQNKFDKNRVLLWRLGEIIGNYFNNPNQTIVLSNACISGVLALNIAATLIKKGSFDNMIVTGGDIVSSFVVSGFMSFLSLSPMPCKPFDLERDGLSLGEGAGTIILGNQSQDPNKIAVMGGGSANDANHISGPSRTGEGSFIAIKKAISESRIEPTSIDYISAHGTATDYNDEMESIAISRAGLEEVPVNSFKGNWGHTLGAAGIIETVAMLQEMRENILIQSAGYSQHGVSKEINVIRENTKAELNVCLKMASGFGGSNASLIAKKIKS